VARSPSPGKAWSAIVQRLRGARYLLEDVAYALGRVPRALGRGAAEFWRGLGVQTRRHLLAALGAIVLLLVVVLAAAPALPCSLPGGDECAPADDAADLVPAHSLAYVHLNVDPDTDQFDAAADLADRLPLLTRQVIGRLLVQVPGPNGAPPDYRHDFEPWFGGEAAIALVPADRGAEQVQLLEVDDQKQAEKYASQIAAGATQTEQYRDVNIDIDDRGLSSAITSGFLVIGTDSGVHAIVDVATGAKGARSLADDADAKAVRDRLPDKRLAEVYVSPDGAADLLAGERGPFASAEPFVDAGATTGAAAALVARDDGLELAVRSDLDADRAKAHPGFFAAFPGFDPQLAAKLAPETLAYLGFGDPGATVKDLLAQASAQAPGLAAGFTDLVERLRELGQVDLQKDLLPALGDEAALALQPGGSGEEDSASEATVPFVQFLAAGVDEEARQALARLQGPIAHALEGSEQQAPVFTRRELAGVQAESLRVSPTVDLTYAIVDSLLVVASDPQGVEQVAGDKGGLASSDGFEQATDGLTDDPSLLASLNVASLLHLAEVNGLGESPAYATFAAELRKLETMGLAVHASRSELDTDVRLAIGSGPAEGPDTSTTGGAEGTTTTGE
jgi:hypothetical protein